MSREGYNLAIEGEQIGKGGNTAESLTMTSL